MQTLRIAFFGESGSGKTALVSSYFGYQQRHAFEQSHGYRLSATDTRDGNVLLRNYYGMQEGAFPPQTVSRWYTFRFDFKVSGLSRPALRLEWLDYPGGWWGNAPEDVDEQQRRRACILQLLTAQVGVLLVDGSRFQKEGASYLRALLGRFASEARSWQQGLVRPEAAPHLTVIDQWIVALAKADLFPSSYTAEHFAKSVICDAMDELNDLGRALYGEPQQFGTRFMLLSAAQGEQLQSQRVVSVDKTVGLELIAPAALLLEVERQAGQQRAHQPQQELSWWQQIFVVLHQLVQGPDLRKTVGKRYEPVLDLLQAMGRVVQFDVDKQAEQVRVERARAVQEGDALAATAAVMHEQLRDPAGQRAYHVTQE